jgi:hypothetical protein
MRVREKPKGCLPARFCGLARDKAAPDETGDAELLKFGETLNGNPEPSPENRLPHSAHQGLFNEKPASR